jgi:LmbE family N-acetylglucosaminyl deacetylase
MEKNKHFSLRRVAFLGSILCIAILGALLLSNMRNPMSISHTALSVMELKKNDRILILAPHPDDEALNCSGIIQEAVRMGLPLKIAFLTNGDSNEWSFLVYRRHPVISQSSAEGMGRVRHDEAIASSKVMGLSPDQLLFLGYPDFGTLAIWDVHWDGSPPYESILTRVTSVPYDFAFRPNAAYKGEEILGDLKKILGDFKPTKIFVSHPADHNPDHQALYLFTTIALLDYEGEIEPELACFMTHFKAWPAPGGYLPKETLVPPSILANTEFWKTFPLIPEAEAKKLQAIEAHKSQYESSSRFLCSFVRVNELFESPSTTYLQKGGPSIVIATDRKNYLEILPDELTDFEKKAFVGVEGMAVREENNSIIITVTLSRVLQEGTLLSIYTFGYRRDVPFGEMPKVHIKLDEADLTIYDKDRLITKENVRVTRNGRIITVDVPLELLDTPEKIFISARTYLLDVPLDWAPWKILGLSPSYISFNLQ